MSIKKNSATEKNHKMKIVQNELKNILQHKILNEVPEIKRTIEALILSVSCVEFKNEKPQPKMIEGEMKTSEEILEIIKESSGYTKWKFSSSEFLEENEIKSIKESFNIDFKENEIKRNIYSRSRNDRSELSLIIVTVLPGLYKVELHTDRVGYGLKSLVNNKQFEKEIAISSEN